MRRIALPFVLLSYWLGSMCNAAPLIGQDYLALQHPKFDEERASRYLPTGTPIGILDNTFGNEATAISRILNRTRPLFIRVHILNTTCVRNRNCGSYELTGGYTIKSLDEAIKKKNKSFLEKFKRRVEFWKEFSRSSSSTRFLLSPALEHNLSKSSWRVLADSARSVWPEVQLVNSPAGGVSIERYKGAWIERHGKAPGSDGDITSLDGSDASDIDIEKFLSKSKNAKVAFIWSISYNCRIAETWQDPRKRTECPDGQQFELLAHIADERPKAPGIFAPSCKRISGFKSPWIWKPFAEYAKNDSRSYLPVAITKYKSDLRLLASNGKEIGRVKYYGAYTQKGLYRAYSGYSGGSRKGGYQFEKAAIESSGSPWVWIKSGTNCNGPFIPGRRAGVYR